jgi:ATP-binding cassette subfamily F protein uup
VAGEAAGVAPFATVTITHDRLFLQRVANRILELDRRNPGGLLSVDGDYATFIERKADLMAAQERRETSLRNTLRRETEWLRAGAPARTTKQQARIQRAEVLAGEVDELAGRNVVRSADIDFIGTGRNPRRLIEARGIAKSYGDKIIFAGLDLFVGPGSRVGLIGPNGCGKSTLLRVLVGDEPPDAGTISARRRFAGGVLCPAPRGPGSESQRGGHALPRRGSRHLPRGAHSRQRLPGALPLSQ